MKNIKTKKVEIVIIHHPLITIFDSSFDQLMVVDAGIDTI